VFFIAALKLPAPIAPKLFRKKRGWFDAIAPAPTKPPIPTTTEGPKDLNGTFQVGDCAEKINFICMVFTQKNANILMLTVRDKFSKAPVMKTPMQKQKDCMAAFKITQSINALLRLCCMKCCSANVTIFMILFDL
jgi:hypothetical protein